MDHLEDLSVDELHAALENVEGKKPTQRLLAAIAYKNGVTQTELADWHNVERKTIYSWLNRLDAESLEAAVEDEHRPGRPRKLSEDERLEFERTVQESPPDAYDVGSGWSPSIVQQYLVDTYDVHYSLPSCRRILKEVGFEYRERTRTNSLERRNESNEQAGNERNHPGKWVLE
ncbi:Transposase [Natronorubrum sediminis]|uniref:Transposase n=1 Tax=Natronorubrum sediminis TaxID=640943 RepID=A0A1H6G6W1_9EURY|nr:Transposase [Natronorubrum sediminis]